MNENKKTVAVLGASPKPERYSYQCVELLKEQGYEVIPVTPAKQVICGFSPVATVADIDVEVDVLTMYVNAKRSSDMEEMILNLKPKKIIFNPGAENSDLEEKCKAAGIEVENACTLILLHSGQF